MEFLYIILFFWLLPAIVIILITRALNAYPHGIWDDLSLDKEDVNDALRLIFVPIINIIVMFFAIACFIGLVYLLEKISSRMEKHGGFWAWLLNVKE